jgi:hypothetical protein
MADKDITIGIKTTGAEQSAADIEKIPVAIDKVDKASEKLDKSLDVKVKTTGADAAARDLDKVENATRKAEGAIHEVVPSANQAEAALHKLGNEAETTSLNLNSGSGLSVAALGAKQKIGEFTTAAVTAKVSTGNLGSKITQVGYQVQDFAVQTASGTSAVRAFSQQAPQLLSAFGPWGVVAGTAIAIGAPLAASLFDIGEQAKNSGLKIEKLTEALEAAIEEANKRLVEGITGSLDQQFEEYVKLRQSIAETTKAEIAAQVATLSNDEKIRQSKNNILESLGFQIDKYKEIKALADAEDAKRKLQAEQSIQAENATLENARLARTDAQEAVAIERQKMEELLQQRQKADAELGILLAKRSELQKTVDARPGAFSNDLNAKIDADRARKQLDNPIFSSRIDELQNQVSQIEETLAGIEGTTGSLRDLNVKLEETIIAEQDQQAAVDINIERIKETQAADTTLAKSEELLKTQEATAQKLTEVYGQIETTNAAGEAAKQTILAAAADGKVTADEQKGIADDVRVVISQIQSGQASTKGNLQELINLQKAMVQQAVADGQLIRQHSAQINQLFQRLR